MTTTPAPPAEDADRILLVDDDATNLDVLRHTLDGRGYRLFVTRNGESAIDVARRVHPLLILLDVVMPGIDGYETCRRLKADPETREAAVIFLSSLDDTKDKVRGLEVGAVDFVSKPFQKDEVIARVDRALCGRSGACSAYRPARCGSRSSGTRDPSRLGAQPSRIHSCELR